MNGGKVLRTGMWALIVAASLAHAEQPSGGATDSFSPEVRAHKSMTGMVERIAGGAVFLTTDEGATREFSLREVKREGIEGLSVGDRLQLVVDQGNQIVRISRVRPAGASPETVQLLEGKVSGYDSDRRTVTLQFEDGESQSFVMGDAAATRMNNVKMGTYVMLELDPTSNMVEDFD